MNFTQNIPFFEGIRVNIVPSSSPCFKDVLSMKSVDSDLAPGPRSSILQHDLRLFLRDTSFASRSTLDAIESIL